MRTPTKKNDTKFSGENCYNYIIDTKYGFALRPFVEGRAGSKHNFAMINSIAKCRKYFITQGADNAAITKVPG